MRIHRWSGSCPLKKQDYISEQQFRMAVLYWIKVIVKELEELRRNQ